jgi:immune inhibitor A
VHKSVFFGRLLVLSVLLGCPVGLAMPPLQGVDVRPGALEEMRRLGVDVIREPVRDAGMRDVHNRPGDVRVLVSGTKRIPAVAIEFLDQSNIYPTADFGSMLFGGWPSGSAKDYYHEVSYDQFTLTGAMAASWVTADNVRAYYGSANPTQRAAMLAKEAAEKADDEIDYSQFDNDGDGYVDAFTCIHSGYGAEETGSGLDIWSHSWDFTSAGIGAYVTKDVWPGHSPQFIKVNNYVICPERSNITNNGTMVCIGVYCHEWGHALGLPDLYDTDGGGQGLGNWTLMAGGSWGADGGSPYYPAHLDAWCKMELGWLNPTAVRLRNLYSLPQVETNDKAYWLMSRSRTFKEYFLVENRRKTGFDVRMYNSGLLIYHIDDSVIFRRWGNNAINNGGADWLYGVALEQADGADHLYGGGNRGDANDPWPGGLGRTNFDSTSTTPNSRTNYPTSAKLVTGCLAKNIPASAPTVQCTLASGTVGQFTGGPDAAGYRWIDSDTTGGPSYGWNDISSTGTLLGYGDDARWSFSLPYNFNFYGTSYNTVWVCSNGWLAFGSDPGTNAAGNVAIPNPAAPNNAVFAFWDDLNGIQPDSGGIYYRNLGSSPNCSTVVMWKHARVKPSMDPVQNQVSFEVVLYEGGEIQLRYHDIWLTDTLRVWGRSASAGIENSGGTVGLQYLYNGSPVGNLLANERAIRFLPPSSNRDVAVASIIAPSGPVDSSSTPLTPQALVTNRGDMAADFPVTFTIAGTVPYSNTQTIAGLNPGDDTVVSFAGWTPQERGTHATRCYSGMTIDYDRSNDTLTGSATVVVSDVAVTKLLAPTGLVDSNQLITPACTVANYGSAAQTFPVRMRIGGFYDRGVTVTNLAPGAKQLVQFNPFLSWPRGKHAVSVFTQLAGDIDRTNDTLNDSITVRVRDVACTRLLAPFGTYDLGTVVTPACTVMNYGSATETYNVRMRIGSAYNQTAAVTNHAPTNPAYVVFPNWTAGPLGNVVVRCSTELSGDCKPSNNRQMTTVTVRTPAGHDVSCTHILAPAGLIDSGTNVTPRCSVRNYGDFPENYWVGLVIGSFYSESVYVSGHAAKTAVSVTFPVWTANQVGSVAIACSTRLGTDVVPGNDRRDGSVLVLRVGPDVSCAKVVSPAGLYSQGTTVAPACTLYNYGNVTVDYTVHMQIGAIYDSTTAVSGHAPGTSVCVYFPIWIAAPPGTYDATAYTQLAGDIVAANDTGRSTCTVLPPAVKPWTEESPMLSAPSGRVVKDGAWLSFHSGNGLIYAAKGNKSNDFYYYNPATNTWVILNAIPVGAGRSTYKGGCGAADNDRYVYAVKGNNTQEFYRYSVERDSWTRLADIPLGRTRRKVKGGTDIAYVPGYLYLLKGYKNEFWRYEVATDTWQSLPDAPSTARPKWNQGSWLASNGADRLYAHKAKYHELWTFDLGTMTWDTAPGLNGMPFINSQGRTKKSKDGGCGTWYSGALYALKGGNTQEFWKYTAARDSWAELETVPAYGSSGRKRKVKNGADITGNGNGLLFILKGNKTDELWRYVATGGLPLAACGPERYGVMARPFDVPGLPFVITPNPLASGAVTLRCGRALTGPASVDIFDATGRAVLHSSFLVRSSTFSLDLRSMSAGVYLVRLTSGGFAATQKLVLQR